MAVNWAQIAEDFRQKYESTYCRYRSPYNKSREVFNIHYVDIDAGGPPNIVLHNEKNGELYLKYTTEAELDFTFPEVGYFQHKDRAMRFFRRYTRQWKKGICSGTSQVYFPYNELSRGVTVDVVSEQTLTSAFQPFVTVSLGDAIKKLQSGEFISVACSRRLALGLGNKSDVYYLWYDNEPIAEVTGHRISLADNLFDQEIRDFLRDTGDYARAIV